MKKIGLLIGILLLVGCNKQDVQHQVVSNEGKQEEKQISTNEDTLLDVVQLIDIIKETYPNFQMSSEGWMIEFFEKGSQSSFKIFEDYYAIKIFPKENMKDWKSMMVQVYIKNNYELSKNIAFSTCKNIWSKIDEKIPIVIDELVQSLDTSSLKNVDSIKYGYSIELETSDYSKGYPVVCSIANARK